MHTELQGATVLLNFFTEAAASVVSMVATCAPLIIHESADTNSQSDVYILHKSDKL